MNNKLINEKFPVIYPGWNVTNPAYASWADQTGLDTNSRLVICDPAAGSGPQNPVCGNAPPAERAAL